MERAALRSILDRRLEPYEGPDLYFQLSRDQSLRLNDPLAPSGPPSRRANYARMRLRQRLRDLEKHGVLTRTVSGTSPPSVEYALTLLGEEFLPVIHAIVDVGQRLKQRSFAA